MSGKSVGVASAWQRALKWFQLEGRSIEAHRPWRASTGRADAENPPIIYNAGGDVAVAASLLVSVENSHIKSVRHLVFELHARSVAQRLVESHGWNLLIAATLRCCPPYRVHILDKDRTPLLHLAVQAYGRAKGKGQDKYGMQLSIWIIPTFRAAAP